MRPVVFLVLLLSACIRLDAQKVKITDFKGLEPLLHVETDSTYVINFWATWCIPCVKELPCFQQIQEQYADSGVRVILVSLDFMKDLDTRLKPFIQKNNLTPEVLLLNDSDSNSWIDMVSPDWSGALPATLIITRNRRQFFERSFTCNQLQAIVNQTLNEK